VTPPAPLHLARNVLPLIANLQWAIGGSLLLYHLGLNVEPRDLDIVGTLEDFEQISARLASAFGQPSKTPHPSYVSIRFSRFQTESGVNLDLMAGVRVRGIQGELIDWHFDPRTITHADGLPWMRATDWVDLYALFNRPDRVRMLKQFIAESFG
jgi:hypothetical protein